MYTTAAPRPTQMTYSKASPRIDPSSQKFDGLRDANRTTTEDDSQSVASAASQDTLIIGEPNDAATNEYFSSHRATPSPLNTAPSLLRTSSVPISGFHMQASHAPTQRSISMTMGNLRNHGEDSPVMNETLSVIDEHIIDMNTPRSSLLTVEQRCMNDSESDYSAHIDHRLSYINGHETDEEERNAHTEKEVMKWTPEQVAEFLQQAGVENRHCEVFREQEISGEVLLSMDQASVFMKEFDLGLVGRRLRTWHKIKAFQEEVKTRKAYNFKTLSQLGSDASSEDLERTTSGAITNISKLPRIPSLIDRTGSKLPIRQARQESPRLSHHQPLPQLQVPNRETTSLPSTATFSPNPESPRPSAASIRELNHARRHSSVDFNSPTSSTIPGLINEQAPASSTRNLTLPHKKQPSLDRNWTMEDSISPTTTAVRPTSALGTITHSSSLSTDRNTFDPSSHGLGSTLSPPHDNDRGYASGGEIDHKKIRNVLRKRDGTSASHSRQSSYKEEQQRKNVTGSRRHSRFGSADSIRETLASVASSSSKMNFGTSIKGRFSSLNGKEKESAASSQKDASSPIVSKLDSSDTPSPSTTVPSPEIDRASSNTGEEVMLQTIQSESSPKPSFSLRAVSDTLAESEKASTNPPSVASLLKESPQQSPTRTGSTTTSSGASKSFELESTDVSSKGTSNVLPVPTPSSRSMRRKSKKTTSAYTRGLEKKSPQEQMIDCDYSGWMKKKSPSLITTWKPRLFVLRGRRLSYYYTENDVEEKGLIDISSHRVLSADNERLTGLHATFTGAKSSPTSPSNAQTPTLNSTEAAAQPESTIQKSNSDNIFIFKLVPPRTGLSRAVNFTKPTIHYFAVDNVTQGRLWMAALMKATIDRDDNEPIVSTYQQKTISLAKAKALRYRPPALMGSDKKSDKGEEKPEKDETGLNIQGLEAPIDEEEEADSVKALSTEIRPATEPPTIEPVIKEKTTDKRQSGSSKASTSPTEKRRKSSVKEVSGVEILFGAINMKGHK